MNSLFGGGPLGAGKQSGSSSNAAGGGGSSTSNAGGWGSMLKNAINQVESQLDKYLEIPNENGSNTAALRGRAQQQQQQQQQQMRGSAARQARLARLAPAQGIDNRQAANGASPLDTPRSQSRASKGTPRSESVSRSSTPGPGNSSKHSAQHRGDIEPSAPATVGQAAKEADQVHSSKGGELAVGENDSLETDLMDAFGVELEQEPQPASTRNGGLDGQATETPKEPVESTIAVDANSKSVSETKQVQPVVTSHSRTKSDASSPSTDAASHVKVENPYIQAELKKLRTTQIPAKPENMRSMIEEKNKRIEALLIEGQEWSAKELRLSNTIKKLRAEGKSHEKANGLMQKKLEAAISKNDELSEKLKRASLADRATADNVKTLNAKIRDLEGQRKTLERELKTATDAQNSLKASLAKANDEVAGLRSEISHIRSAKSQEATKRSDEIRAEAEQQSAKIRAEAESAQQRLQAQIEQLQQRVMVVEEEAREREVSSLTQIRSLQSQLRNAEVHNSDVTAEVQEHTLPLLRQIEELHMRQTGQRHEWAAKERDWAAQLRASTRSAEKMKAELDAKAQDVGTIQTQVAAEVKKNEGAQAEIDRLSEQIRTEAKIRADIKQQLDESHATIQQLNSKIEGLASLRAAYADTQERGGSPADLVGAPESGSAGPDGSLAGTGPLSTPRDLGFASPPNIDKIGGFSHIRNRSASSVSSVGSRSRRGSGAEPPSHLQQPADLTLHASNKKLGAQITSLKAQLQTALKQKHEYSRNLVDMSVEVEKLRAAGAQQQALAKELDELKHRHATALEMLGEKTEEVMELQADIKEVKDVYKQQLQQFLKK
ncbi:hypothetical protein GGI12_003950 [Dipsacomyces acuminosporus]|nr:hypothetical protein GGI12_003950 [Dipsacomyces acuminosporus]